jgi:excisionase family DNA binding protein
VGKHRTPENIQSVGVSRAARLVGVSERTIRRLGDEGRLRVTRDDAGRRRFSVADLEQLVAERNTRGQVSQ